jgi:hypothetical protein
MIGAADRPEKAVSKTCHAPCGLRPRPDNGISPSPKGSRRLDTFERAHSPLPCKCLKNDIIDVPRDPKREISLCVRESDRDRSFSQKIMNMACHAGQNIVSCSSQCKVNSVLDVMLRSSTSGPMRT